MKRKSDIFHIATRVNLVPVLDDYEEAADKNKGLHQSLLQHVWPPKLMEPVTVYCVRHTDVDSVFSWIFLSSCHIYSKYAAPINSHKEKGISKEYTFFQETSFHLKMFREDKIKEFCLVRWLEKSMPLNTNALQVASGVLFLSQVKNDYTTMSKVLLGYDSNNSTLEPALFGVPIKVALQTDGLVVGRAWKQVRCKFVQA